MHVYCESSVCSNSTYTITVNVILHRRRRKVWSQHHLKGSWYQGWGLGGGGGEMEQTVENVATINRESFRDMSPQKWTPKNLFPPEVISQSTTKPDFCTHRQKSVVR